MQFRTEYSVLSTRYPFSLPLSPSLLLSVSLSFVLTGCVGEAGPECHPVSGTVSHQGQPLAEAQVVFHPLQEAALNSPQPIGQTDAAGRFTLTTLKTRDGAPEGEYAITVELREPRQIGEEVVRDGRNLLPARYASSKETPLRFKVLAGKNEVPELKLQ